MISSWASPLIYSFGLINLINIFNITYTRSLAHNKKVYPYLVPTMHIGREHTRGSGVKSNADICLQILRCGVRSEVENVEDSACLTCRKYFQKLGLTENIWENISEWILC